MGMLHLQVTFGTKPHMQEGVVVTPLSPDCCLLLMALQWDLYLEGATVCGISGITLT